VCYKTELDGEKVISSLIKEVGSKRGVEGGGESKGELSQDRGESRLPS